MSVGEADVKHTEYHSGYGFTDADYVVRTFQIEWQVRIHSNNTDEVLTMFYATDYRVKDVTIGQVKMVSWRHKVYRTLKHMGITTLKHTRILEARSPSKAQKGDD